MALTRLTIENYGVIEQNFLAAYKDGKIESQTLLSATDFTEAAPAENGMGVVVDAVAEEVVLPTDEASGPIHLVATEEALYNQFKQGLNNFAHYGDNEAPKLPLLQMGDTFTTNTICFDIGEATEEFLNEAAALTALDGYATTPTYAVPSSLGAWRITQDGTITGAAKTLLEVIKVTTLPNGDYAVKLRVLKNNA